MSNRRRDPRPLLWAAPLPGLALAGAAWGLFLHPTENLSESAEASYVNHVTPQSVVAAAGEITVVWHERPPGGEQPELFMRRHTADGWTAAPLQLTATDNVYSGEPALAADAAGGLHLAWIDRLSGAAEVWVARIDPKLGELVEPEQVSSGAEVVLDPTIAVGPGGKIYVAWTAMQGLGYEIRAVGWTRAEGWSPPGSGGPGSRQPQLSVGADGAMHLVWIARLGPARVVRHRSLEDGVWSAPIDLPGSVEGAKLARPAVGVDAAGRVHVVFEQSVGAQHSVLYASWTADAAEVPPVLEVAGTVSSARVPNLVVDGDGVAHIVWEDARSATLAERSRVVIAYARVEELTVTEERQLSDDESPRCSSPAIAVDEAGGLHLVWEDQSVGAGDIVYRRGGLAFEPGAGGTHRE